MSDLLSLISRLEAESEVERRVPLGVIVFLVVLVVDDVDLMVRMSWPVPPLDVVTSAPVRLHVIVGCWLEKNDELLLVVLLLSSVPFGVVESVDGWIGSRVFLNLDK